jgi:hypothetical protein
VPGFFTLDLRISDPQAFVRSWKRAYQADGWTYNRNIRLGSLLDSDNVERLMCWKAGQRFQASAAAFARAVPLVTLNSRRIHHGTLTDAEVKALYDEITNALKSADLQRSGNIIWAIFLCHVARPQDAPIYDVNVWRAWGFIEGWLESQHFRQQPKRFSTYLEFRAWHNALIIAHRLDQQELDQALMAFGQFLSSRWGWLIR